jgi:hypothetical protein
MNKYQKILTIAALIIFSAITSTLGNCDQEDIETVGDGGGIIVLLDGTVWESLDPATSSTWLPSERVLVCRSSKIINRDENGGTVDVIQLR